MATSDNGWSVVGADQVDNTVAVAGVTFPGGFRKGNVAIVFGYLFDQLHTRVEPIVAGWCWGFENRDNVNNPGSASCHSSATAGDYNAPNHPNGARGTWTAAQVATIRQVMAECPAFLWGADFTGTADEMHWQIANSTSDADLGRIIAGLPDNETDWYDMATKQDLVDVLAEFFGTPAGNPAPKIRTATVTDGKEDAVDWPIAKAIGSTGTHAVRAEIAAKK